MKKTIQHRYINVAMAIGCWLLGSVLLLTSCKKDDEMGNPVIKQIRITNPQKGDSTFTQALPGTLIVIQGENLAGALNIYFNGLNVPFNATYNTNSNIILPIPSDLPTEATLPTAPNTIRVVTDHGEVTSNFTFIPPPPTISGLSNEYALSGETVSILGKDFYLVQKIVFPGAVATTAFTAANDGTSISVKVPDNVTEGGPITIVTKYGEATSLFPINDMTGPNILCNFDNKNILDWGCQTSNDNDNYPGARGKFANLLCTNLGAGNFSWWEGGRSINTKSTTWIASSGLNDPVGSYALKFEIFVKEKWDKGAMFIVKDFDWKYLARYEPWKVGTEKVDVISTGWNTITIPLTQFKTKANGKDGTGTSAPTLGDLLKTGTGSINFFLINDGTEKIEKFNLGIDNIRVVKIK